MTIPEALREQSPQIEDEKFRDLPITSIARHWHSRWPQGLTKPALLAHSEEVADATMHFTRNELFDLGQNLKTDADVLNFYVAVCSWGSGNKARSIARVVKPLHQPEAVSRIRSALETTIREGAVEGYSAFNNTNKSRVKHLGPAFFTKLMYFSQGAPVGDSDHALILDKRVAQALGMDKTAGWSTATYEQFLKQARELRAEWMPNSPLDAVEYQLFTNGK